MLRNEKGFTLIEIIAVLVILGILAAVAVPRYLNMQGEARGKAMQSALAALQSTATQSYAQQLLNGSATGNSWTQPAGTINVGDFSGNISGGPDVTVTVTNGPTGWAGFPATYSASQTFKMW